MVVYVTLQSDENNKNEFCVTEFFDNSLQNKPQPVVVAASDTKKFDLSHWKVLKGGNLKYSDLFVIPFTSTIHQDVKFLFVARSVKLEKDRHSVEKKVIIQSLILKKNDNQWEFFSMLNDLNVGESFPDDSANFQLAFDGNTIWLLFRKLHSFDLFFVDPNTKNDSPCWYPARIPNTTKIIHVKTHLQTDGLLFTGSGENFIDLAESEFNFNIDIVGPYFIGEGDHKKPVTVLNEQTEIIPGESLNVIVLPGENFITTFDPETNNPEKNVIGRDQVSFVSGRAYNLYSPTGASLPIIYGTNNITLKDKIVKYDHRVHGYKEGYTCHKVTFFNQYCRVKIPNSIEVAQKTFIHYGIRLAKQEYCFFSFPTGCISVHHIKNNRSRPPKYTAEPPDPKLISSFRSQTSICDIRKGADGEILLLTRDKIPGEINDGILTQWKLKFTTNNDVLELLKVNQIRMFQNSSKDVFLLDHEKQHFCICLVLYDENLPDFLPCITCSCHGNDARRNRQNNLFVGKAGSNFYPMYSEGKESEPISGTKKMTSVFALGKN